MYQVLSVATAPVAFSESSFRQGSVLLLAHVSCQNQAHTRDTKHSLWLTVSASGLFAVISGG